MPNLLNESVEKHYRPWDNFPHLYLLLCDGARVTVRSQQVRAMNLVYALHHNQKLRMGTPVAVIGGGAAGITFAAAAASLGAHVKLFEAQKLMHLQLGSWHRPLHPEVYTWPYDTAYRPVSHMPLLGWTTGPAHEVATEIVSKFRSLAHQLGETQLKINEGETVQINHKTGHRIVNGRDEEQPPDNEIVIIATGFGVERSLPGLPLLSYWRSDYLDQPFLGTGKYPIVIVGSGDGGLCDLLRACVPYTDQTAFLDTVLGYTLSDSTLRDAIKKIEKQYKPSLKPPYLCKGRKLQKEYCGLKGRSLSKINELLMRNRRPDVQVQWLIKGDSPFNSPSLPIYRFLASRLINQAKCFNLRLMFGFEANKINLKKDHWVIKPKLPKRKDIPCRHVVYRAGQEREEINGSSGPLSSVINSFDLLSRPMLISLAKFSSHPPMDHKVCNEPKDWDEDEKFLEKLKVGPLRPLLLAEFVRAFNSPDPIGAPGRPFVFRIRIWLRDLVEGLTARYDLHPEEHKPITRYGAAKNGEQWVNTRDDYTIRVRLDDGREWSDYSVLGALGARYRLRKELDRAYGATLRARQPMLMMVKKKDKDGWKYSGGDRLAWAQALQTLQKQSR